jgi:hypothetical protein
MTVDFRVDKEEGIVYGTLTGVVDVDQILEGLAGMVASGDFRPGLNGITDLRNMVWESDQDDLRRLVHFMIEHREEIGPSRSAIVVAGDRAYGMSRMFEVFSEESSIDVRVFRDFDEAKRWIVEGDGERR